MIRITTAITSYTCHTIPLTVIDMRVEALVISSRGVCVGGILVLGLAMMGCRITRVVMQVR